MRRVLSLWFPTFATDLVKRRLHPSASSADKAVILTHEKGGRKLVAHACAAAAHAGVRPGTDLTHALSMLPAGIVPHVRPDRPARNLEALEALARRLLKISPLVAPDPPDGALLDITPSNIFPFD